VPKKSKDVQSENANGARSPVKKTARKKPASKKKPEPTVPKTASTKQAAAPTDEQIRIRAYFIAEKRAQLSIKGDHHSDWLEAKRQLFAEAGIPLR